MSKLANLRERLHCEEEFPIVEPFQGRVLRRSHIAFNPVNHSDNNIVIRAFRLDAVVDEGPDGYARAAAYLVAGSRLCVMPHRGRHQMTFVAGTVGNIDGERIEADLPAMRHAFLHMQMDITIPRSQAWPVEFTYDGPDIPLAFARIIAIGVRTREVQ